MTLKDLAHENATPFLAMSRSVLKTNYNQICSSLPVDGIHFAVKSNPDAQVLAELANLGAKFEVASTYELDILQDLKIRSGDILYSNPVKSSKAIETAYNAGVRGFAVDSFSEIEKIAKHAPGSQVYIRVLVNDFASRIPLSKKFGLHTSEVVDAVMYAADRGLDPVGLTFHVGSQASSTDLWDFALQACGKVMRDLEKKNMAISIINLGGGFPVVYKEHVPDIEEIGVVISTAARQHLPYEVKMIAEPGRYLVAEAGTLITEVISRSVRSGKNWAHTDTSAFHGLLETMPCQGQIQYPIDVFGYSGEHTKSANFTLTGPTCDYLDTYADGVRLPLDIGEGTKLAVSVAGAYTLPFASNFNGFPPPKVYIYD